MAEAPKRRADAVARKQAADLAAAQHDVADKTKAAAAQAKSSATGTSPDSKLQQAGDKTAAAAKMMEEAARDFAAGKTGEGQAKASEAKTTLQEAGNTLQNTDRSTLEAAISNRRKPRRRPAREAAGLGGRNRETGQGYRR